MKTTQRIGFGKKIRLDWLALGMRLRVEGRDFDASREALAQLIGETNAGKVAITKALSNVRQVVFAPTVDNEIFTDAGLTLLREHGDRHTMEIAWGLSIASYSFFAATVETAGRLLRLHEEFTAIELVRRLSERAGDRGFVDRVGRYNLSSILDWGALELDTDAKKYHARQPRKVRNGQIATWLIEAVLIAANKPGLQVHQLTSSPVLFPFDLPMLPAASIVGLNPRLSILRQNLNEELVSRET